MFSLLPFVFHSFFLPSFSFLAAAAAAAAVPILQVLPGEVITAKVNARLLSSIPETKLGNLFLMLDLHVQGILQYFEGPSLGQELYAEKVRSIDGMLMEPSR